MPLTTRLAIASFLISCPFLAIACSQPTPELIEGKTPAEYHEEAEQRVARPVPESATKSARPKAR